MSTATPAPSGLGCYDVVTLARAPGLRGMIRRLFGRRHVVVRWLEQGAKQVGFVRISDHRSWGTASRLARRGNNGELDDPKWPHPRMARDLAPDDVSIW